MLDRCRTSKEIACGYLILAMVVLSLFLPSISSAEEERQQKKEELTGEVEAVADNLQYLQAEHKLVGVGNVVVVYGAVEMTADEAEIKVDTKESHAKGHVLIRQKGGGTISGDEVWFDFENRSGKFPNGRFFQFPWYGYGKDFEQVNEDKIVAKNVHITTCDLPHPHYDVKAQEAFFYPGDKIIAKNVTFRILEVPVFWWPYLIIPLDYSPANITPGYSDEYGGFVLFSKGYSLNRNVKGRLRFDWYSKRGFGFGGDLDYKFDNIGVGEVKIYGIQDQEAPDQRAENPFQNQNRREKNRGRVSWKHKARIDPFTTLQLQWHELSDEVFLQDFFEREHREEIDPLSFITVSRNTDPYSLVAHIEKRTNRSQSVGEKLPEIVFTWFRKPLFDTDFYYTHEDGFVNFTQTRPFLPDESDTFQFYSDHELSYPLRFFRFYNFIPFVGFREDYFTNGRLSPVGFNRFIMSAGFDSSTRYYGTWDYEGKVWGIEINGLRHVLEPIIQYNAIKVATVDHAKLIETGRGDRLDLQDIITFGVENRIQTKRKTGSSLQRVDLVSFNAFLDFSFGPGSDLLRTKRNRFTEARTETILRPYDWLAFRMDTVFDMVDYRVDTNNLDLIIDVGKLHLALSHRYQNDQIIDDKAKSSDNQLTVDGSYQLNDRWTLGGYVRWETTSNELEEWEIRGTRDLHDWLFDFGYNVRNSDRTDVEKELNKEFFAQLRLKALPAIDLKTGHRASFSDSRIGRTVSGSNEAPPPPSLVVSPDAQYASLSAT